ncbi:MAG: LysM peptidoglycan-binding domain-containing protein [Comamonadaceae bacterium]|nr:LysM peptidoglycan-binding domain-containing protein [Rubrivivax sp.]NLZ40985.1 LysM peptidoglycan-binding domain-containing protein [Comamonadaceae bacterium]
MDPCNRRDGLAALPARRQALAALLCAGAAASLPLSTLAQSGRPVLPQWRATAERVAQAGIPIEDLAPNAPDSHTVQRGDTLWGISALFLESPWRWPELWGMNLEQIRNPHLIYPGQVLVLEKRDGRATLRMAGAADGLPPGTVKLSPRVRVQTLDNGAIAAIPLHLIGPFLNEAVVFDDNELDTAPRIVAAQEGHVLLARGETAYVRGELGGARDFRVFRQLTPLVDPETRAVLGYEGRYVGTAELVRPEQAGPLLVPATFRITSTRLEAGVGDRLAPVPQQELVAYVPHPPARPVDGRIISVYGEGVSAGQNQVVALNRGKREGIERGNVLALWRAGRRVVDTTTPGERTALQLPDERHGLLFVFRVFERVSYALILSVQEPVTRGDRFTQP